MCASVDFLGTENIDMFRASTPGRMESAMMRKSGTGNGPDLSELRAGRPRVRGALRPRVVGSWLDSLVGSADPGRSRVFRGHRARTGRCELRHRALVAQCRGLAVGAD